jgi:hypothetical protein
MKNPQNSIENRTRERLCLLPLANQLQSCPETIKLRKEFVNKMAEKQRGGGLYGNTKL